MAAFSENELRRLIEEIVELVLKRYSQPEIECHGQTEAVLMDFTQKRVLTELAVRKGRNAGYIGLRLGKATIITPLAMDYISSHNMTVIRQEE